MEKLCEKCGAELDENGLCPKCALNEDTKAEKTDAPEKPEKPEKPEEPETPKAVVEEAEEELREELSEEASKFTGAAGQVWRVIKGFFSKNAVDTIASQYSDEAPIWLILFPAYAVLSAISAAATFNAGGSYSSVVTPLLKGVNFGAGEIFFLVLMLDLITMFALAFGVRVFIKLHKGDGHFVQSANLVSATQLPLMVISAFNVVTGGVISGVLGTFTTMANIASTMLLFSGISRVLGGKKPIWSFFLMIICVSFAAIIVTVFVASPIIFSSVAYSIMDSFNQLGAN